MGDTKIKKELTIDGRFLGDRKVELSSIAITADRENNQFSNDYIDQLIAAIGRSETSTLGYAAAGFAPVIFLLGTLSFISELGDDLASLLTVAATVILGFAGSYFALYKALFLSPRRIFL